MNQVYKGFVRMRNVETGSILIVELSIPARVRAYWRPKYIHGTYARAGMKMSAPE